MTDTATRERPILFSGEMVRAILGGTKTQTRRVVKCLPALARRTGTALAMPSSGRLVIRNGDEAWDDTPGLWEPIARCPYGQPGDRLWVRETWRPAVAHICCAFETCYCADVNVTYAADGSSVHFSEYDIPVEWELPTAARKGNVPSIHMPKWASRITLEITSVRVERLHGITTGDIAAEGFTAPVTFDPPLDLSVGKKKLMRALAGPFAETWDKLNASRGFGWDANPWVWVVEFKRVEADNEA